LDLRKVFSSSRRRRRREGTQGRGEGGGEERRGRQCRMSKKGQEENKNTQNTQIDLNK